MAGCEPAEICPLQARGEIAQPLHGAGGLLQAILGEVQLAAIGYDASGKRSDEGLYPLPSSSRSVKKLPRDLDIFCHP